MMTELFGQIESTPGTLFCTAAPIAKSVYKIATWYAPDSRWKIWPDEFTTRYDAETKVARDLIKVRGHTHYCILELRLPGSTETLSNAR